ncbi:MAG: flagellar basal-body MS-ring/collar protein FliF [Pseudomonadota bacterium]|nr:flagellar M-ring protein FliF [Alphaproteobacteria bacterium]
MNEILQRFGIGRLVTMAGIGLGLMIFFGYIMVRANQTEMALLYSQIEPAEGGRIIERLKSMGTPFEVKGDGTQIYAPSTDIAKLRMELAQNGMPSGGTVGYEIFDKQDILGTTNALLGINQIRALEGELGKSVQTIQGIQSARVHLVIPKRELFSENKQEPSASVMVRLKGTSALSATQVQSIRYLVASAVPSLTLDHVSIVDDRGNLLARGKEMNKADSNLSLQQTAQQEYEQRIARAIESLLDRTLGANKTRAEVSVDLDFDQVSSTSVLFDPDGQVIRSQTITDEGTNSNENSLIGGDSVSIQNTLPTKNNSGEGDQKGQNNNHSSNSEESINYEISHSTKTYVKELGTIRRLSIAVMVDGTYKKNEDGTQQYQPLSEDELKKLQELVKTATGFKENRGDVVSVVNMKFSELPQEEVAEAHDNPLTRMNINRVIELGITALIVLIGLFTVVKPLMSSLMKALPSRYLTERMLSSLMSKGDKVTPSVENKNTQALQENEQRTISEDTLIAIDQIDEKVKHSPIKKIAELVDRHPEEAVSIIRSWMSLDK